MNPPDLTSLVLQLLQLNNSETVTRTITGTLAFSRAVPLINQDFDCGISGTVTLSSNGICGTTFLAQADFTSLKLQMDWMSLCENSIEER